MGGGIKKKIKNKKVATPGGCVPPAPLRPGHGFGENGFGHSDVRTCDDFSLSALASKIDNSVCEDGD